MMTIYLDLLLLISSNDLPNLVFHASKDLAVSPSNFVQRLIWRLFLKRNLVQFLFPASLLAPRLDFTPKMGVTHYHVIVYNSKNQTQCVPGLSSSSCNKVAIRLISSNMYITTFIAKSQGLLAYIMIIFCALLLFRG